MLYAFCVLVYALQLVVKFCKFNFVVEVRQHAHHAFYLYVRIIFHTLYEIKRFFGAHTALGYLRTHIDFHKAFLSDLAFCGLFFNLFCKVLPVKRVYQIHLAGNIFDLVRLQLSYDMPRIFFIVVFDKLLHSVFAQNKVRRD